MRERGYPHPPGVLQKSAEVIDCKIDAGMLFFEECGRD
jgi:hypothetical protein